MAAIVFCTVENPLAAMVVVNAPWTVAVVVYGATPPQLIEPPSAICAKLGWPPDALELRPVQVILAGSVG